MSLRIDRMYPFHPARFEVTPQGTCIDRQAEFARWWVKAIENAPFVITAKPYEPHATLSFTRPVEIPLLDLARYDHALSKPRFEAHTITKVVPT